MNLLYCSRSLEHTWDDMKIVKLFTDYKTLFIILIFSAVLRIWNLGSIPPGLTPDEASLGYNAYSILKTGRDEYGELFPIIFKSFGDYKPGLYVYLTIPFVALLGLSEFAVRLPSALAGVTAVWLLYKIVELLLRKQKHHPQITNHKSLASIAALLLAISPWHIHFSRGAWEANLSLTLTLAGILLFLKSLKNAKFLIHTSIFFSLTLLTYQGAKLSTTIVIITLIIVFWKEFIKIIRDNLPAVVQTTVVALIITSPILLSLFQGKTGRLEVFSILSYRRPQEQIQTIVKQGEETVGGLSYSLFHSEGLILKRSILGRWFNHFSTRFLFFEGDWQNLRHSAPNHGMLLLSDLILLIIGFIVLVRRKSRVSMFILLWLILAPLPAALSRDQVHAVRALNMVIPLTIISAIGLEEILRFIKMVKNSLLHYSYFMLLIATILGAMIYFLDSYFVHLPIHNAKYWFYGYKQAVTAITPIQNDYKYVIFQQSYDQPYIYFLFYQKYDPSKYQKQAKLTEGGVDVGLVERLDNVSFESFSWPFPTDRKNTLVVGNPVGIPLNIDQKDYKLIKEIKYPDDFETAFRIVEVK